MSDKTKREDLEMVLAKLGEKWQELADLLTNQGESHDRVVEVEKILLRDASGQCRGNISANPDGSTDLRLSDQAGNAWVRLGVNKDGEAFFELKDQKGESSFKVAVGTPGREVEPGPAAPAAEGQKPAAPQPDMPVEAGAEPRDESGPAPAPPAPDQDELPGRDADAAVFARVEKLARQYRRLKWFGALILALLGVTLATQAYVFFRPQAPGSAKEAFVLRDPKGNLRASLKQTDGTVQLDLMDAQGHRRATLGLGADGAPGLSFYDQDQKIRAELNLGPDGEPKFTLRDQRGLEIPKEPKSPEDSAQQQPPAAAGPAPEAGALPTPPAAPAEAVAPKPQAKAEVEFVGSKTSNKYHYPTCKWVKAIVPWKVIKFKSVEEAQKHHYIPCPVCKPPPLSKEPSSTP